LAKQAIAHSPLKSIAEIITFVLPIDAYSFFKHISAFSTTIHLQFNKMIFLSFFENKFRNLCLSRADKMDRFFLTSYFPSLSGLEKHVLQRFFKLTQKTSRLFSGQALALASRLLG
jgi:hypothetical protein